MKSKCVTFYLTTVLHPHRLFVYDCTDEGEGRTGAQLCRVYGDARVVKATGVL